MVVDLRIGQLLVERIFPHYYFRKKCISLSGFGPRRKEEKDFNKKLAATLKKSFPLHTPTACCCIFEKQNGYEGVLTLHKHEGQSQIRVEANSFESATDGVLKAVSSPHEIPPFRMTSAHLCSSCKDCSIRKAHRVINKDFDKYNPLH